VHRFRIEAIGDENMLLLTDAGQVHHLKNVLRLGRGDEITVFDDAGMECLCSVNGVGREEVTLTVRARRHVIERRSRLMIACAVPKRGMDDVVDKLTQLGVDSLIPMRTQRVVAKLGDDSSQSRIERWMRLARAAAEQSHRSEVLTVGPVTDFTEVIAGASAFDLRLIATLAGHRETLISVTRDMRPASTAALIGPEGDFSDDEIQQACSAGFVPVDLGQQVLRVDTAAIAVAAYLRLAGIA
jgi:16S rRNA (uracil1498-N3)-methyltransferase